MGLSSVKTIGMFVDSGGLNEIGSSLVMYREGTLLDLDKRLGLIRNLCGAGPQKQRSLPGTSEATGAAVKPSNKYSPRHSLQIIP